MSELHYERDINIDPNSLDLEWLGQAAIMLKYCQHAERVRKDVDLKKEKLDIKRAELDKEIRTDPEKYNISRISEGAIANAILLDPDYQQLSTEYIDAKFESNMASAAVRAFDQRKSALENLVRLHAQQYFAGPKAPRNLAEESQKKQERSNARIARAMQRRRSES